MEKFRPKESLEKPKELTGHEKMSVLLSLFGNENAKNVFISTGRDYLSERRRDKLEQYAENYIPRKKRGSPPKRAELHNQIMDTIQQLALATNNLTPIQEQVFKDFGSREEVSRCLIEYFSAEDGEDDDDQDKPPSSTPPSGSSGVAFWHNQGREH